MKKLNFKLLLIFLLFIFACSGPDDEITESKKPQELPSQVNNKIINQEDPSLPKSQQITKKPSSDLNETQVNPQLEVQKKNDGDKLSRKIIIIDFIADEYSRECLVDTLGPKITFEIYQSKKIQQNETEKITGCLTTLSDISDKSNNKSDAKKK